MKWLLRNATFVCSNWKDVLTGGIIVVGVIIFLMGLLKKLIFDKIPNKMVRKTLLSFMSIILVAPATAVYILYKGGSWDYFWTLYILNSMATIIVYWFYEGTHLRELLGLIGKNTIVKCFKHMQVEQILEETKEKSRYKEDDLKKL